MLVRLTLLVALLSLALAQWWVYAPRLPERMASHFSASGAPNGWSSPGQFFGLMFAINVLYVLIFVVSPLLIKIVPARYVNLPNRDYWLSPERLPFTMARMGSMMLEFAIMSQLLTLYAVQLVIQANLGSPTRLASDLPWALGIYFIFVCLWCLRYYQAFAIKAKS